MDWKEILKLLLEALPKLAFKPELIEKLSYTLKTPNKPGGVFMQQLDIILEVTKQNQRVAEMYGYASLEVYEKQVEALCGQLLTALRQTGANVGATKVAPSL